MVWVWIIVGLVALVAALVLVLYILGKRLPEEHVAALSLPLKQPVQVVWDVISDTGSHGQWAKGVTKVEPLEPRGGKPAWRLHMGRNSFVIVHKHVEPPRLLAGEIDDDHKMFSGRWEYVVEPEADGSRVTLTEYGRVPAAIPRAMMHYMMGLEKYLRQHLESLARKFGEEPRIEPAPAVGARPPFQA